MTGTVNQRTCAVCPAVFVGADVLCARHRARRDRWQKVDAEIKRLEAQRAPTRPLRIVDLRRSRERAS